MELFLTFVVLILFFYANNSIKHKGRVGEARVKRQIASYINGVPSAADFHDVTLKTPDGTTQIDHIVLSPCGIFVIETKNLKGWIYGSEAQSRWTQVVYKKKNSFQNPLRQNYKHIKALETLLGIDQYIHSVVVFAGNAIFKTPMPHNVIKVRKLKSFLMEYSNAVFSDSQLATYRNLLSDPAHYHAQLKKEHVKNVKGNRDNPLCPKCGSKMTIRTARRSANSGKRFWGCSTFPKCRGIKQIN
ncbi:MAG: NERD domain-containing protein [Kangiellaceae bacterium]|jgi:hypothetical protein|nr:NERD domain-containing protein [Kangiellaceae bacterium]